MTALYEMTGALELISQLSNIQERLESGLEVHHEEKIVQNIYSSLLRVDANIDYKGGKICENNHSISEAAGLFIGDFYFHSLKSQNIL